MASMWPFRRSTDGKKAQSGQPSELRIATSGSFSIRATIESLRVDGAGSYAQPGRARAALFVPTTVTTVQFHGDGTKKPGANSRSSCVHVLQMFTAAETASILADAMRIGTTIGWSDRGVSLPTQDVLVSQHPLCHWSAEHSLARSMAIQPRVTRVHSCRLAGTKLGQGVSGSGSQSHSRAAASVCAAGVPAPERRVR